MEVYFIPVDQKAGTKFIIYRPLLKLAFVGNQAMVELVSQCTSRADISENINNNEVFKFLDRIGYFEQEAEPPEIGPRISAAVLLLTNRCQLRCSYCYAAGGEREPEVLSVRSGKKVIDYVCEQAQKNGYREFNVEFFGGGEPSLEWKTLKELVQYSRSKAIPSRIKITSNVIWSIEQCRWIIDNIDGVSVSMDGSPTTQDKQRPFRNNMPSSPVVMRNLNAMDQAGYKYGIRMTACNPWNRLAENVGFILENTSCRTMQVEPAFNTLRGSHTSPSEEQSHQFASAFMAAYEIAKDYRARLTYSGARPEAVTTFFCFAPYNAVVVNPADNILACYEIADDSQPLSALCHFGKIKCDEIVFDESKRENLYRLMRERREITCKNCFCRWSCAGDCFTRAFSANENGHLEVNPRCDQNREITRELLLDLIHTSGGVWGERNAPTI